MSDQTSQEPTMEEILASIRRIISEDDAPPEGEEKLPEVPEEVEAAAEAPELPEIEPEPEPEPQVEDDVLELTERVDSVGDLDVYSPTAAPAAEPEALVDYAPAVEPPPVPAGEALVGDLAASAAASAFGKLSATIGMPASDRTLEDVVRELLRPLLKQWLDDNLPAIVETTVQAEVERIARNRVR
jgi:cell pole-organizing protein PopZ